MDGSYKDAVRDEICSRLADGESLIQICKSDERLPNASTVYDWINEDPEFAQQITRAREIGYMARAERAVFDAKTAEDAGKGRLAFDAERWYLGKLSNAFSDDKARKHEHSGPNGAAIPVAAKLDMSGLTDEQLSALASIRI